MARGNRNASAGNPMHTDGRTGKTYPSVGFERLRPPAKGRAIDQTGTRIALWKRAVRTGRIGGIAGVLAIGSLVSVLTVDAMPRFFDFLLMVLVVGGGLTAFGCLLSLARVVRIWRFLERTEWTVYKCGSLTMRESMPITMVLEQGRTSYPITLRGGQAETLRGMPRPEVWFAGDPSRRGIVTVAGGGEIFLTRPVTTRAVKAARSRKPRKPAKIKPVNPRKQQRDAERARKARARTQERAKQWAAKQAKKPVKPPKPRKPPKIPRGGQRIKFPGM